MFPPFKEFISVKKVFLCISPKWSDWIYELKVFLCSNQDKNFPNPLIRLPYIHQSSDNHIALCENVFKIRSVGSLTLIPSFCSDDNSYVFVQPHMKLFFLSSFCHGTLLLTPGIIGSSNFCWLWSGCSWSFSSAGYIRWKRRTTWL